MIITIIIEKNNQKIVILMIIIIIKIINSMIDGCFPSSTECDNHVNLRMRKDSTNFSINLFARFVFPWYY